MRNNLVGEMSAGAVDLGGSAQAASAGYSAIDAMAASIVRLYREADELRATIALLEAERDLLRVQVVKLVNLQGRSRRATLDEISESVREKYDERYDLNAMHEAEMCIPEDKQALYDSHLVAIVGRETGLMPSLQFRCLHASAKQRAKAFLRTVGKWEEGK